MRHTLHGWTGRVLHVDLSGGTCHSLPLPEEARHDFLGGRGLAMRLLQSGSGLAWDAPDMPLVFAAGPLTGTEAPATSRCHAASRSPLTGAVGDESLGGELGMELKRGGFDALVVTGRSPVPRGIEIDAGEARLTDASALSGLPTPDLFLRLRERRPSGALLATGPAAENGCPLATLMTDARTASGRCGLGLAAGAKGLKYVAVRGCAEVRVADPAGLAAAVEDILRLANASPALMGQYGFHRHGTMSLFDLMDARRMMPTDNFARTRLAHAEGLNANAFETRYHPLRRGCPGCPVQCLALSGDGRPMPEYEAQCGFSALIGNTSPELVMRANDFCACLGLDPVGAASALACHRELTDCAYGPDQVLALLLGMATGQGPEAALGRGLGQGVAAYAAEQGRPELAMAVKGLALPPFDPRGGYGLALAYAVSTQGGSHLRANPLSHEVLRKPVATDRFSFSGKARIIKLAEDAFAAAESLTLCRHMLLAAGLEEYARALAAVTGEPTTGAGLIAVGERVCVLERQLNAAWGFGAVHDDLPERFFTEPGSGAADLPVPPIARQDFLRAREAYYSIRGLDAQGKPLPETAARLGLSAEPGCGKEERP